MDNDAEPREDLWHPLYWLLLTPFVALLWPAFYASIRPELAGVPFFIWYQFLWVLIAAALTALVYALTR